MTATLSIHRNRHGGRTREVIADCEHGTTTIVILDGDTVTVSDRDAARMAAERLLAEEHCRCARRLVKRYGGVTV